MSSSFSYLYPLQVYTASISLVASLVIIIMILVSPNKLTTPYRRIIFGMSMADVLQSLALITGPFAIPADTTQAPWSSGNVHTCDANGFFMVLGSTTVPVYMFAISMLYFCKLNMKMTNAAFAKKIEKWIHIVAIVPMSTICFVGLAMGYFNASGGGFCYFEPYPFLCTRIPEAVGECTRGANSHSFLYIITFVLLFCFIGISIFMAMLCIKACTMERVFRSRAGDPENTLGSNSSCCLQDYLCCIPCREYKQFTHESDADYFLRLYKREIIIQSSLYVGAFFGSYVCPLIQTIASFSKTGPKFPQFFFFLISILYPLGGLFNILVYTRPKVVRFRHIYPEKSRLGALIMVIKAGGEVPEIGVMGADDHRGKNCCCKVAAENDLNETPRSRNNAAYILQMGMLTNYTD
jgi:hypothetical protein